MVRVLGGLVFSLGLILVVVAGAELFTGNNLLVMAWADRKITTTEMLRNWMLVYPANAVGAIGLAIVVYLSHHGDMNQGAVGLACRSGRRSSRVSSATCSCAWACGSRWRDAA
jgi:formate/nitrite transporter FocA (FNT family)